MPPARAAATAVRAWDVCEQSEALFAILFPHLAGLRAYRVEDTGDAVVIFASCEAPTRGDVSASFGNVCCLYQALNRVLRLVSASLGGGVAASELGAA